MMIMSIPFPWVVDDADLTNLEEVFDPPLTSLPLVAPSFFSTPIAASINDLTLLASPLPLALCTRLEMGEISKGDVSVLEDDSLDGQKRLHWLCHILRLLLRSFVVMVDG